MGQGGRPAGRFRVDVAVDDVVLRPGEEVGLFQAGEDRVLGVLLEGHAADEVGGREVRGRAW